MPKMTGVRRHPKTSKTWQYRIRYTDSTGSHEITKNGFLTQRAAKLARDEYLRHLNRGATVDRMEILFFDFNDDYINTFKPNNLAKVTTGYFKTVRRHLAKFFPPDQKIATITPSQFQRFINAFADGSLDDHKPRAAATVAKLISYVSSLCNVAMRDQILYSNFADYCQNPGYKQSPEEATHKFLQVEDVTHLLSFLERNASLENIEFYELITEAKTGTRCSETLALTWDDIDFDQNQIHISRSWDYQYTQDFKPTKNDSSARVIPLAPSLVPILKRLKSEQAKGYLASGYRDDDKMLFRNLRGKIPANKDLNDALIAAQQAVGIEHPITTHGLRHTLISYLLGNGVNPLEVANISGHKDFKVMFEIYTHLQAQANTVEADKATSLIDNL